MSTVPERSSYEFRLLLQSIKVMDVSGADQIIAKAIQLQGAATEVEDILKVHKTYSSN
jgi:hypothetical protein